MENGPIPGDVRKGPSVDIDLFLPIVPVLTVDAVRAAVGVQFVVDAVDVVTVTAIDDGQLNILFAVAFKFMCVLIISVRTDSVSSTS